MTKLILSILLSFCLAFSASAWNPMVVTSGSSVSCYDMSGTAIFLWECNSTIVGDTGFSPCGGSDGDTSTTATGDAAISAGICVLDDSSSNGADYFPFDVSSDDIFDDSVGTVFIRFRVNTTFIANVSLWRVYVDAGDYTLIQTLSSGDLRGTHSGNTTVDYVDTTTDPIAVNTIYVLRYRWEVGRGVNDHSIGLFSAASVSIEEVDVADSIAAFDTQATSNDLIVGTDQSSPTDYDHDIFYIHIYSEWLDTDPNI